MAATRLQLHVWFDDDDPDGDPAQSVWTDQRDMAAAEVAFRIGYMRALDERPAQLFRWLAWHALRRTGQLDPPDQAQPDWDKRVLAAEPDEPQQAPADPTNQGQ